MEALLAEASVEGVLAHELAPLAAGMLRRKARPVPVQWLAREHEAKFRTLAAVPVLEAVRESCGGPVVLMKGPEVAARYPRAAREFSDLDLLVPDARMTRRQLKSRGFVEVGDPARYERLHHLRPLARPGLPLTVELHSVPKWPAGLRRSPSIAVEVIQHAVPSALGIDGILAPDAARHTLLLAAHAWAHEPLRVLRDLVDVSVVAAEAEPAAIERVAREWGLGSLWRTTDAVAAALFAGGRPPVPLRLWARHLTDVRERTVLEGHLERWLAGYWALGGREAVGQSLAALRGDLVRNPGEPWGAKIARTGTALRHARASRSSHAASTAR